MKNYFVFAAIVTGSLMVAAGANAVPFSRADRNKDGYVDYNEAKKSFPRLSEIHFLKCDSNGDGFVDKGEFPCLDNMYRSLYKN
jgi:hypothetical protein